jgi:hypothetical protein
MDMNKRNTTVAAILSILVAAGPASAQGLPFNEDFSTTTLRGSPTTADWSGGQLKLPTALSVPATQSLNNVLLPTDVSTTVDAGDAEQTRTLAIGDLDGDGDIDIVYGNAGANAVYFNNGAGGFSRGSEIPQIADQFGGNTRSAQIADFNGDGHMDVLFSYFNQSRFNRILFNNGSGGSQLFSSSNVEDLGAAELKGDSTAIGDVDNDGDIDVVVGVLGDYVQLFRNDGFGNFSAAEDIVDTGLGSSGFHALAVVLGDIDEDNDLDLVAATTAGTTRVYRNNGAGIFNSPTLVAGGGATNNLASADSVAMGDLNGDGLLDLVIGNNSSGGSGVPNRIYMNQGLPGLFSAVSFEFTDSVNTNSVRLGDVDRDGDLDIVTGDMLDTSTADVNRLYLNDGTGTFPASGTSITADTSFSRAIALGDLDNDGDLDLALANDTTINQIVLNNGTLSGVNADQLTATARSVRVDNGEDLSNGVIMTSTEVNAIANPAFTYWVSNNGGTRWVAVQPGRTVGFPTAGTDLRWRVDIGTLSTAALWRPAVASLGLSLNGGGPSFTSTPPVNPTINQGVPFQYDITATDPDGAPFDIHATSDLPAWLVLTDNNAGAATLAGTPTNEDVGVLQVDLEVWDGSGLNDTQSFTITVVNVNDPPVVIAPTGDQTADQNAMINIDMSLVFEDPDLDVLTYTATGLPDGLSIDMTTGILSGTLTNAAAMASPHAVAVTANDGLGGMVADAFAFTVNNVNDAPEFTSAPVTAATEAVAYSYDITAPDPDGDAVTITAAGVPAWATFTDNGDGTASIAGTPAATDIGAAMITLTADDLTEQSEQMFTLTVSATPPPPPPPPPPAPRSSGGGGAFGPLGILLMALVALGRRRRLA